jgi:hypothetical protein
MQKVWTYFCAAAYVGSIQALEMGPKLLVMADHLLGEIKDEYRFDIDYFKT